MLGVDLSNNVLYDNRVVKQKESENEMELIKTWDLLSEKQKIELINYCGWTTNKKTMSPTGKKILKTDWNNLSDCVKTILERKLQEIYTEY